MDSSAPKVLLFICCEFKENFFLLFSVYSESFSFEDMKCWVSTQNLASINASGCYFSLRFMRIELLKALEAVTHELEERRCVTVKLSKTLISQAAVMWMLLLNGGSARGTQDPRRFRKISKDIWFPGMVTAFGFSFVRLPGRGFRWRYAAADHRMLFYKLQMRISDDV
jgi:hypothetical protein